MLQLNVKVVKARNLYPKDSNGLSDSYCVVKLGREKAQTKVIKESLNPVWNELFVLSIENSMCLEITCWDNDILFRDFLGRVVIKLKDLFDKNTGLPFSNGDCHARPLEEWYVLQKRTERSNVSGDLKLEISIVADGLFSKENWQEVYRSLGGVLS